MAADPSRGTAADTNAAPERLQVPWAYRQRIDALLQRQPRVLLGLAGPPGAGKSTLAAVLQSHYADMAQVVPMDGYHLAQVELERLGRAQRKGAPDTFDGAGYVSLLRRLRAQRDGECVYAPAFRREIEEPIAGAIAIEPQRRLLIAEGNYLLLDHGPWAEVGALLDEVWYVDIPESLRLERLLTRHMQFGRDEQQARAWMAQTDEPNARLIEAASGRASCRFRWDADPSPA